MLVHVLKCKMCRFVQDAKILMQRISILLRRRCIARM